jgi:hypothetical protein
MLPLPVFNICKMASRAMRNGAVKLVSKMATKMVEECNSLFNKYLAQCDPIHFDLVEFCSFENMHKFGSVRKYYEKV